MESLKCKTYDRTCLANFKNAKSQTKLHKDEQFANFAVLESRDQKSKLKYLPLEIGKSFSSLEELRVVNSNLEDVKSEHFADMGGLINIFLEGNALKKLSEDTFNHLPKLKVLNLNRNKIDELPKGIFAKNGFIEEIFIVENSLTTIENLFDSLQNLKVLNLNDNKIAVLAETTFDKNVNLEEIYLMKNSLTKIEPKTFESLKKLKNLNLAENQIAELSQGTFDNNEDLETLNLRNNQLNSISSKIFANNKKLGLKLENFIGNPCIAKGSGENVLEIITKHCKLPYQDIIDVWHKKTKEIEGKLKIKEDELDQARKEIAVKEKKIEQMKIYENRYENLTSVYESSGCKIDNKRSVKCNFIESLYVAHNNSYRTCQVENFVNLICGSTLEIEDDVNELTSFHVVRSIFTNFPSRMLNKMPKVEHLEIESSKMAKIEKNLCDSLTQLKFLLICGNEFGKLLSLGRCEKLIHLRVEYNEISELKIDPNLPDLTDFSLRGNIIKEIPENFFTGMKNLKNLQMAQNKLEKLAGKLFDNNHKLVVVNFSDNPIIRIESGIFGPNSKPTVISFENIKCLTETTKWGSVESFENDIKMKCQNT